MSTLLKREGLFPTWAKDLISNNRLFGSHWLDFNGDFPSVELARIPSVNITENEKEYKLEMAAPGLERNDFKVEVKDGMLSISAEKEKENKEEKKNFTRREYSYNSFSRAFTLPDNSEPDHIQAKYEKGILSLVLPKKVATVAIPAKEIAVS